MSDDLISRQEAIAHAISGLTREIDGEKWIRVSEVRESIKKLSPASPGRKTGKWISLRTGGSGKSTTVKLYPICSECGFEHSPVNYCPNCGAKMDSWIVDFAMTEKGANDV